MHCTFLDPYLSPLLLERYAYGANADWADNYYTRDLRTLSFTEGRLSHAHNVDVGWLDGDASGTTVGFGGRVAISTHSYPHQFYLASVRGENEACAAQYGYARSKAGDGWEQREAYPKGNTPVILCPPADAASIEKQEFFATVNQPLRFEEFPFATSAAGVSVSDWGFGLSGRSPAPQPSPGQVTAQGSGDGPAWLAVAVPVSNAVSFVQFEAGFTSTNGAEGLLTVYWNTNEIGLVDERVEEAGLQTYRFALPGTVSEGLYTLSFRLDAFNGTASSVSVTSVMTGFAGFDGSIRLDVAMGSNGAPVLKLTGKLNHVYLVQSSTNLLDWEPTALLVNTNGTVQFTDPAVTNHTQRFYRALAYAPYLPGQPNQTPGTVVGWGSGWDDGAPGDLSGCIAVTAGDWHSLALKSDGTVNAWGNDQFGQITVPEGLNEVIAIAAAEHHSMALKSDGTVVAWGAGGPGQSGDVHYGQSTVPADLSGVIAIAAGGDHSLAVKSDGTVVAWGKNFTGQCTVPGPLGGVIATAAGESHSLALKLDGTVVAWGNNEDGQCAVPENLSGVVAIAAGRSHNLALKSNGTVVAWGRDSSGQSTVPEELNGVTTIAAGGSHSLALKSDGTVVAWGQSTVPDGLNGVLAIAGGLEHSLAIVHGP